jgi:hypothetical protein
LSEEFYNFAEDSTLDPEENKKVREQIVKSRDKAPSSRVQTDSYRYFQEAQNAMLGSPYDVSKIPINVLTQMKFDSMIAFGDHFITMPLLKARWHIECEDAQVAAFVDNALRRIYADYILQRSQSHFYGFKPIVKRFELDMPDWRYRDDAKSDKTLKVWDSENVKAVVWKHFVGLPSDPNICEPIFNAKGEFNGIKYNPPSGTRASFGFSGTSDNPDSADTKKIPGKYSLWAVNQRHLVDGCSPPDELVLTGEGYVPISELDPDKHQLAQFSGGKILRFNRKNGVPGHKFEVGSREYEGDLITITTPNGSTRVTPNHKLTVRWQEEIANKYAVYIMRKADNFRIGIAKVSRQKASQNTSGVLHRMFKEGADESWIVDIFDTKAEAIYAEQKWSHKYNIPDLTFKVKNHVLTQDQYDSLWGELADTESGAIKLLSDQGRDINYPLYKKGENPKGGRGEFTVAACNLFEQMRIPTDPGVGQKAEWHDIKLDREYYKGLVYSLEVPPYNHYISNGNITQNSLWGFPRIGFCYRYWFSYWLRWALYDRYFERKADPPYVVYYPTDSLGGEVDENNELTKARALSIGDAAKSGGTIALPGDFERGFDDRPNNSRQWEIKELEINGDLSHFVESFEYLDKMKIRALLVPDQALMGAGGASSNRNAAEQEIDMFKQSEASEMEQIDDEINRFIIPDIIAANFPDRNVTARKVTTGFDEADLDTMKEIIRVVGQSDQNALKAVDFEKILETMGIPSIDHDELVRREEKVKQEIANAAPEPLEPVAGEQAGVDEEGFYVQPRETIKLSEDTDFITALPPTKHYTDEEVLDIARQIRAKWNIAFKDIYDDIAKFISNEDIENFSDEEFIDYLNLSAKFVPNKPGVSNWVEDRGGLPKYIADIAGDLISERGFSVSRAIATAVNKVREWCRGGDNVKPDTRAKACAALAKWNKMKLQAAEENLISLELAEDDANKIAYKIISRWNFSKNKTNKLVNETKDLVRKIIARAGQKELARIRSADSWSVNNEKVADYLDERGGLYIKAIEDTVRDEVASFLAEGIRSNQSIEEIAAGIREHFSEEFPGWKSIRMVRSEVRDAYNYATLEAAEQAGIRVVQAKDAQYGDTDQECMDRNNNFYSIPQALIETLKEHPNGTLEWILVPEVNSIDEVTVDASEIGEEKVGYFDDETEIIYFSETTDKMQRSEFRKLLGEILISQ